MSRLQCAREIGRTAFTRNIIVWLDWRIAHKDNKINNNKFELNKFQVVALQTKMKNTKKKNKSIQRRDAISEMTSSDCSICCSLPA